MTFHQIISEKILQYFTEEINAQLNLEMIQLQETRKEFEGDLTLVVFPLVKFIKKSPQDSAEIMGNFLCNSLPEYLEGFNVVKGFLNLVFTNDYLINELNKLDADEKFESTGKRLLVEYSSPNTNKPLHLGHIRNNLLGHSVSLILQEAGNEILKVQVINDRGIHICKSMYAWMIDPDKQTPEESNKKGDHLIGEYYVRFNDIYVAEQKELIANGKTEDQAKEQAPSLLAAREMLRKWEANDPDTRELWKKMNAWVYKGFEETYAKLEVDFDKLYYESETYLKGKAEVLKGLKNGIFYQKEDSSIWADLKGYGLDEKILIRSDGTSVYITQDLGTAIQRFEDYGMDGLIYTVGNEQEYHFKVLFILLEMLGYSWAKNCYHLSYGMVDLPSGKMKSREGTVVDADDLIDEIVSASAERTKELGKIQQLEERERENLYKTLGLGALRYYLLKVDPKKRMLFNPEESIDLQGNTGPFIQYSYARIQSVLRKAKEAGISSSSHHLVLHAQERSLINLLMKYKELVIRAADEMSPALIANYCYDLATEFNRFYHDCPILKAEEEEVKEFRLYLADKVGNFLQRSLLLLGIRSPERM